MAVIPSSCMKYMYLRLRTGTFSSSSGRSPDPGVVERMESLVAQKPPHVILAYAEQTGSVCGAPHWVPVEKIQHVLFKPHWVTWPARVNTWLEAAALAEALHGSEYGANVDDATISLRIQLL